MTEETEKVYQQLIGTIANACQPLLGADYYDLLQELNGHLTSLMDCYEEEHPEDFK